jgi:queuine/archaeosine tRNA-ribosyltransferase
MIVSFAIAQTQLWLHPLGRPNEQNLFGIMQGGLDPVLRRISAEQLVNRNLPG